MQLLLTVINWTHRPRCSYRVVSYVPRRYPAVTLCYNGIEAPIREEIRLLAHNSYSYMRICCLIDSMALSAAGILRHF